MMQQPGHPGQDAGPAPATEPPPAEDSRRDQHAGWNTENLRDYRRLRRSRDDRKVAGVAGGLGRHLDVDPTVIRVLLVVLVFFGGAGLLMYGALWLLVPEEGTEEVVIRTSDGTRNALLIAAAVIAGLAALGDTWDGYGFPWPLLVAALLVAIVLSTRDRHRAAAPPTYPPAPSAPGGAATGPSAPPPPPPPGTPGPAPSAPGEGATAVLPQPGWYPPPPPPPPTPPRRRGPLLFGPTLALLALVLGGLGLYEAAGGTVEDAAYAALAVGVVGVMLLVGAFFGRPGGLVALGLVASLVLAGTAIGDPGFEGERDLVVRPTDAEELRSSYDVPAGRVELDLTGVQDVSTLDGRSVAVDVNAGEVLVTVPDGLRVRYDADVEFGGEVVTPEGTRDGWGPSMGGVLEEDAEDVLDLEVDLRFGRIEVRQR